MQINTHSFRRSREVNGIEPFSTVDCVSTFTGSDSVVTCQCENEVITTKRIDGIISIITINRVITRRALKQPNNRVSPINQIDVYQNDLITIAE